MRKIFIIKSNLYRLYFMEKNKYFLHTTPKDISDKIKSEWFSYVKWWPTVSWDIHTVMMHSTKQGYKEKPDTRWQIRNILCMELPSTKDIKTSIKWNIKIDCDKKEIHGKPGIRKEGKAQWGIYNNWEHHQWQENILNVNNFNKEKIDKENILLELKPTKELIEISENLRKLILKLKKIDIVLFKKELLKALRISIIYQRNEDIDLERIAEELLFTTIQSNCMSFVRGLYLAAADKLWYEIYTDKQGNKEVKRDIKEKKPESYKLIQKFPFFLERVSNPDFDLFKWNKKYNPLNRYLRSSVGYINKKFFT